MLSPVSGIIAMIPETKHAVLIKTMEGLLVHIGFNTVELRGQGFEMMTKERASGFFACCFKELIVLKNNQPSAVILSPEEYVKLTASF